MGNNKDNDSMAAPKAAGPFSFLKNPSTSGSSVSPTTPDAPTPVEAPQDDASWLVGCNRICLSQLISKQTKKCLEMLKYPFYRGLKPAEHDISDTMMPVYNFVELLTHLQDSPEVRLTSNFAFNHMKLRKWIKTTEVVAHPALTSFFAEWGIEVEPLSNAQSSQNVDKAVVLAEIAIISNAIEHCQRQWEKCFPQAGPQEVLWPEDFTVTEQQALRHFAKIKLKAMGKHLDTQEDRLNAIEEIRTSPDFPDLRLSGAHKSRDYSLLKGCTNMVVRAILYELPEWVEMTAPRDSKCQWTQSEEVTAKLFDDF